MESLKNFGFALFFGSTAAFAAPPLIAIDVGHGGVDGGATSARGRPEFAFNREFAGVLAGVMRERGLGVREVNFAGDIGSLTARPAQAAGSDFFIATTRLVKPGSSRGSGKVLSRPIPRSSAATAFSCRRKIRILKAACFALPVSVPYCAGPALNLQHGMPESIWRPMQKMVSGTTTIWWCFIKRPCRRYFLRPASSSIAMRSSNSATRCVRPGWLTR